MKNVKTNRTFEEFEADWNDAQNQLIAAERGHESSKLTPKRAWNAALASVVSQESGAQSSEPAVNVVQYLDIDRQAETVAPTQATLARELISGAIEVVELFGINGTPGQKDWALDWVSNARKLIDRQGGKA